MGKSQELNEKAKSNLQAIGHALVESGLNFDLAVHDKKLSEAVRINIRVDKHLLRQVQEQILKGMGRIAYIGGL